MAHEPKVNQKIRVVPSGIVGTITAVYPPCDTHSGRFHAYMHDKKRTYYAEFWYSDIGNSVIIEDRTN